MKTFVVGGWVRDTLLRRQGYPVTPSDRDWVVVGASPEEMEKKGYMPVGKDFPVFLHPTTHEEYALARTERKTAVGYKGFKFNTGKEVTLEEDLLRRDLTINAIAMDEKGSLFDPYGGQEDLKDGVLRHVSQAFREDPVRLLRLARFAARYPSFKIAPETETLAREIVDSGEADALVAERIFKEFFRALSEKRPSRFFAVLEDSGFLRRVFPRWTLPSDLLEKIDAAPSADIRFAVSLSLCHSGEIKKICKELRAPAHLTDLVLLSQTFNEALIKFSKTPDEILNLLIRMDSIRRPERFSEILKITEALIPDFDASHWKNWAEAVRNLDISEIIQTSDKRKIPEMIREKRLEVLRTCAPKGTSR